MRRIVISFLCGLIRAYQLFLAPVMGPRCRFLPSCSAYTAEAIAVHGPVGGTLLGLKRLCRCHPWGGSGIDPVPQLRCEAPDTTSAWPTARSRPLA